MPGLTIVNNRFIKILLRRAPRRTENLKERKKNPNNNIRVYHYLTVCSVRYENKTTVTGYIIITRSRSAVYTANDDLYTFYTLLRVQGVPFDTLHHISRLISYIIVLALFQFFDFQSYTLLCFERFFFIYVIIFVSLNGES